MDTWKKVAILLVLVVILVIPLTLLAIDYNGWGTSLSKSTAPVTVGIHKLGEVIPSAMLNNGYIMILCYASIPILMFGFAVVYWNRDWGEKLGQSTAPNPAAEFDNTMKREPDEPERSNVATPTAVG
jgi:hypothetical protein